MAVAIKPLEDRIVVKAIEAEKTTASGLVIPDTAKEKPQEGIVVAIGSGKTNESGTEIPIKVKKGDRVLFSKYGGSELPSHLKVDGKEYKLINSDDILAVLE